MNAPHRRDVFVSGVGLHAFGRFPGFTTQALVLEAVEEALRDAAVDYKAVQAVYYAHVYYQGMSAGEHMLAPLGLTGVPFVNVENACSSGTTALWLAYWAIATGQFDCALVAGAERVPAGPVSVLDAGDPRRLVGDDHMMAAYALRMRRYMDDHGAPAEAIAQVAVKARANAVLNDRAHQRRAVTLEEVMRSRMVADPLTLLQCCPTSEGSAAAILTSTRTAGSRPVRIRGAALRTDPYHGPGVANPDVVTLAGRDACTQAGLGPGEIDIAQVHDASTFGEILRIEALGLVPEGEGWVATRDGRTALHGALPVNTDGGLLAMGHPFGASGIRMLHETTIQLRGRAGPRQVARARAGLVQCSGAGGVCTVLIAST